MFKTILLTALMASTIATPALAADDFFVQSRLGLQQDVRVGFYLKVPLGGGTKRAPDMKPRFGLAMNYTREYSNSVLLTDPRQRMRANLLDLRFSPQGFQNFAVGGQDVIDWRYQTLAADETEEGDETEKRKGKINWKWVGIGAGVVLVAGVTAFAIEIDRQFGGVGE